MPALILKTSSGDRHIEFSPGQSLREALDTTSYRVRSGCRGTGACGLCRILVQADEVDEPTLAERLYLSPDQIAKGVRLACQIRAKRNVEVTILNPAPLSAWKTTTATYRYCTHSGKFPACPPSGLPKDVKRPYGVAVDLGTTHVAISFYDLSTGEWFTGRYGLNPQAAYGTDVMTRLTAACESRTLARSMRMQAIDAIGCAIKDVATREGLGTEQVVKVVLGGNTAMLALLSGRSYHLLLQPAHWMRYIDCLPDNTADFSLSWGIHSEASIEILPPLAGFVGSDLLAGVIATKLVETGPGSLLIDFGTNSEIALWDGKTLWVTSAAGGPAFEGCGISCGMPAEAGAIYQVRASNSPECESAGACDSADTRASLSAGSVSEAHKIMGLDLDFSTIEGEAPMGLCGSGIVDLVACLVRSGALTSTGRFAPGIPRSGFVVFDGERRLVLTKKDVDVFQRAKGAIGAAIRALLSPARMSCRDLQHIYVGGAFGHFLNKANAASIGLLPDLSDESIQLCGNTALAGCECLMMSPDSVESLKRIKARAKIINLSQSVDFADFFLEGLYLRRWSECIT